jgi:hypothetical protein
MHARTVEVCRSDATVKGKIPSLKSTAEEELYELQNIIHSMQTNPTSHHHYSQMA